MTDSQALAAIAERASRGWRFHCQTMGPGWECNAVGAGLAHASCGGKTFGASVGLALHFADKMEDDPEKVIARYRDTIREQVIRSFGPETEYTITVEPSSYDFDAKKLHLNVSWPGSVEEFCRRDNDFRDWLIVESTRRELLMLLLVMPKFPEEAPAVK